MTRTGWVHWAGHAAYLTSSLFGLLTLIGLAYGQTTFVGLPGAAYVAGPLLVISAIFAATTVYPWNERLPNRVVWVGLWTLGILILVSSCFVLLDLIELALTGSLANRHGHSGFLIMVERLGASVVGSLLLMCAVLWGRRISGACLRCGHFHMPATTGKGYPAPSCASQRVRRLAWLGCVAFAPYLMFHGLHAAALLHSTDGLYSRPILPGPPLVQFAIFVVVLIGPAVFLILGLVSQWGMQFPGWIPGLGGRRVPRWLPLAPAGLVVPTLTLYGWGSLVYALLAGYSVLGLGGAASLAFGLYGTALGFAALSYLQRTRPFCLTSVPDQRGTVTKFKK